MAKLTGNLSAELLKEQLNLADSAAQVLRESHDRARPILSAKKDELDAGQRETLEALSARFARLNDFLVQKLFRTLDQYELSDEGSVLDRLNRFEKRGILPSAARWRELRDLRNAIAHAHEYLIEKSDRVVREFFDAGS